MTPTPKWTEEDYDRAAAEYEAKLTVEDTMEAVPDATQRKVTVCSLEVVRAELSGFHVFNELLVQFFHRGQLIQVVPDNMVVRGELEDRPRRSYMADVDPVPFWVLEYVSQRSGQKDYVENRRVYEQELKVPYYLLFNPESKELVLLRRINRRYIRVEPNADGRLELPEVELEVGLLEGWVRFWFRGALVGLPDELHRRAQEEHRLRLIAERIAEQRGQQIERLDEVIQQREEELRRRDAADAAVAATLRPLVEAKARGAGRDDILTELPEVTDMSRLAGWLAELP